MEDLGGVPARGDFTGNHWIEVHVAGNPAYPIVQGSRVTVEAGGRTWFQDAGASSYCSQNSPLLHFGLAEHDVIDRLTVRYPGGAVSMAENIPVDRIVTMTPDGVPARLLSFSASSVAAGTRVSWSYADDGDVAGWSLARRDGDIKEILAPFLIGRDGRAEYLDRLAPVGREVVYALSVLYREGSREALGTLAFRREAPPLVRNFPNPFSAETVIPVDATSAPFEVHIFDLEGRLVRAIRVESGTSLARWDGRDASGVVVPSGAYFYRVGTGEPVKMIRRP